MTTYVGITIGPIFDTIDDATRLSSLWFASTMFSEISKQLCEEIKLDFPNSTIITPFFTEEKQCPYGKYPDRIVFSDTEIDLNDKLDNMIGRVKDNSLKMFGDVLTEEQKSYLKDYIQINYVILEGDYSHIGSLVAEMNEYLTSIEWMKRFPKDTEFDFLGKLFHDENHKSKNHEIRISPLFEEYGLEHSNMYYDDRFRTIDEICSTDKENKKKYKKYNYFAVAYVDIDHMGSFLSSIDNIDDMNLFSSYCSKWIDASADLIKDYNGVMIYAGGDDMFFLAPVTYNNEMILDLCKKINVEFKEVFEEYNKKIQKPFNGSLSFGISIQYKKYPLSEAIVNSRTLLFDICKDSSDTRNSIALSLQKHSGGMIKVRINNKNVESLLEIMKEGLSSDIDGINSVMYTLRRNKKLLCVYDNSIWEESVIDEDQYFEVWKNFFDSAGHDQYNNYYKKLEGFYYRNILKDKEHSFDIYGLEHPEKLDILLALMKFKSFLSERVNANDNVSSEN